MIIGILILVIFILGIISLRRLFRKQGGVAVNAAIDFMNILQWIKFIGVIVLLLFIFFLYDHKK